MTLNLYKISIPVLLKQMTGVQAMLIRARLHYTSIGKDVDDIVGLKLIDDMLPFSYQIQAMSNIAKGICVRVGGLEPIMMPDDETTFDQLCLRIAKTVDIVSSLSEDSMDGKQDHPIEITFPVRQEVFSFTGYTYITRYALPNFYFHCGMAYAILRANGVPIGKEQWLDPEGELFGGRLF